MTTENNKKNLFDDDSEEDAYVPGGAPQNLPAETQATVVPAEETQNLDDEYVPQNYDEGQYVPEEEYQPVQDNQDEMYKPEAN